MKAHSWCVTTMTFALMLIALLLWPVAAFAGMGSGMNMGAMTLTQATPSYSLELDIAPAMLMATSD